MSHRGERNFHKDAFPQTSLSEFMELVSHTFKIIRATTKQAFPFIGCLAFGNVLSLHTYTHFSKTKNLKNKTK